MVCVLSNMYAVPRWLRPAVQVQTDMMGDIHHYAWRARHRNQTVYINKKDAARFGEWESLRVRGCWGCGRWSCQCVSELARGSELEGCVPHSKEELGARAEASSPFPPWHVRARSATLRSAWRRTPTWMWW